MFLISGPQKIFYVLQISDDVWRTYIQMKDVLYRIHMYIEMKDYCIEFGEELIRLSFTSLLRFPGSLVVRIRRSHRRGRGSIPRQGGCFKQCLDIQTVVKMLQFNS